MRFWAPLLLAVGCTKAGTDTPKEAPKPATPGDARAALAAPQDTSEAPPAVSDAFPDMASALKTVIPADARVLGFGEIHQRTDRKQVTSALSRFTTDGLPAIADKLSDLIVETWIVDPKCGQQAQTATAKVEMTVRRPQETKSEIALLADAAKAANIQPHAMKLACSDYDKMAPKDGAVDPTVVLTLTTKELTRIAGEAVAHRDKLKEPRPWIALYGGALHNDRFPAAGVEDWSYAAKVDAATSNHFVEIDLVVPELADADDTWKKEPWFSLVTAADDKVHVFKRGERSFVFVLPKGK